MVPSLLRDSVYISGRAHLDSPVWPSSVFCVLTRQGRPADDWRRCLICSAAPRPDDDMTDWLAVCVCVVPDSQSTPVVRATCAAYFVHAPPTRRPTEASVLLLPHTAFSRCTIIGSSPRKVSPGRQFTGKNPPRPAAARAGRIFAGKLSAGETFLGGGRSYNRETFYGAGDILVKKRHVNSVIISPRADFSWSHFNVTPPARSIGLSTPCRVVGLTRDRA